MRLANSLEKEAKRLEEANDDDGDVAMGVSDDEDGGDTKQDSDQHDADETARAMRERDAKILTDAKRWRPSEDGTYEMLESYGLDKTKLNQHR